MEKGCKVSHRVSCWNQTTEGPMAISSKQSLLWTSSTSNQLLPNLRVPGIGQNLHRVRCFISLFFFFKLESISGEVFRCFHLGRNTVIQCQEENRVSFWSGAHQGQFGEHWRAGVLWHQEPRGWFETKWPQECRWQHFLFLFCVLSSLFPFLPFKMAEKAGAIS